MTRTDVNFRSTTVLDAFHDYDSEGDAVEVFVGGDGESGMATTISYEDEAGTIHVDGYEVDYEEREQRIGEEPKYNRQVIVKLNGEVVATGVMAERTSSAVTVETTGWTFVEVPPNQHVEINIRGEEV